MSEIKFVKFNGIKEYARVMYNDVKNADKYRIDVAYNGRDVKNLLEYLFELEQQLQQKENIIKEVRNFLDNNTQFDYQGGDYDNHLMEWYEVINMTENNFIRGLYEILDKGE